MLRSDAEPLAEIQQRLRDLEGTRTIVRSRRFFVARVDRVEVSIKGFRFGGELLHRIEEPGGLDYPYPCGVFSWSCGWEMMSGGDGVIFAHYVSWCLYYDRELVTNVLRVLDSDPTADTAAFRMIVAWEQTRSERLAKLAACRSNDRIS